jgi:hypothetical protein
VGFGGAARKNLFRPINAQNAALRVTSLPIAASLLLPSSYVTVSLNAKGSAYL